MLMGAPVARYGFEINGNNLTFMLTRHWHRCECLHHRLVPETALFSCFLAILAFTAPMHVLRPPFGQSPTKASVRSKWSRLFAAFQ